MGVPVIEINDLSKRFIIRKEKSLKERIVNWGRSERYKDDFWALKDVNLNIESGTTVGLVGPNGSGKSTLLKMIGGILQPTSGTVMVRGRLAALLELGTGFHPDLTGRENVYLNASILGLSKGQTEHYFDEIVDFSGIGQFIDTQVKFYSSGMYVRLAFSVATYVDPDILLVDEVLAVGDEPFQLKCMDRIRQFQADGRTIILVTHALDTVAELCNRAVVLQNGQVIADGAPRHALRVLRGEFDLQRAEDVQRERVNTAAHGIPILGPGALVERPPVTEWPTIEDIKLLDEAGKPTTLLDAGVHAILMVLLRVPQDIDGCVIGCGIDNASGITMIDTNSTLLETELPLRTGYNRLHFHLYNLNLGEGSYSLQATVRSPSGEEIARKRDAWTFRILADGRSNGTLWSPMSVDMHVMPLS